MPIGQLPLPLQPRMVELEDPVPDGRHGAWVRSLRTARVKPERIEKKLDDELMLKEFLETYGFSAPAEPISVKNDALYPVHIAAHLGDYHLLRLLVAAGADVKACTGRGRSTADVANGDETMQDFLRTGPKMMRLRDLRSEAGKMPQ